MARHGMRARHRESLRRSSRSVPVAETNHDTEYLVQAGDSFSSIARAHGMPTAELLARNGLSWSSGLAPGQRLSVRPAQVQVDSAGESEHELRRHVIAQGETVSAIAAQYGVSRDAVLRANGLHRSSVIFIGQSLIVPPVCVDTAATPAVVALAS